MKSTINCLVIGVGGSMIVSGSALSTPLDSAWVTAQSQVSARQLEPSQMVAWWGRGNRSNSSHSQSRSRGGMASQIAPPGHKEVIVDLCLHQFGAYDANGRLIHSGPISGGRGYCPDIHRSCRTPVGHFRIHTKKRMHYSQHFPVEHWLPRAPMPNSMFFHGGYAIHATTSYIRGTHESHGCIRTTYSDSNWLYNFTSVGTTVIVKPYC